MLRINGQVIEQRHYPDGTPLLRLNPQDMLNSGEHIFNILWLYDNMEELVNLMFCVEKIRDAVPDAEFLLECPYLPNARMDREVDDGDVFTLKYFAGFVNSLGFERVISFDAHSPACKELIWNLEDVPPSAEVVAVLDAIGIENLAVFFPDEGARNRYECLVHDRDIAYGKKRRDWASGKILGLDVEGMGYTSIYKRDFLIVDDICSKGGTFYHSAKKLHEMGAGRIYLYVSHCEDTVFQGRLIEGDEIEHIYTTNSIYRGDDPKISVIERW